MSVTAPEPTGTCALCGAVMHASMLLGHLRGAHDIDVGPETWPDGEVVVVDMTLEPSDFADEEPTA